ncbi:MAG: glycosyltransferase [Verrucomicrobia bacterium]|nr:glycosyltransferase [Verrucomicrobiota bacterium]
MNNPLVSIIIPCHNAEEYIAEAIQSALDQRCPNKEVIVVDDGSTDGSLDAIRSFGNRARWVTGPNRGGNVARNTGLGMARGNFIQFLDADDLLYPDKLAVQMPLLNESDLDVVFCAWDWQNRETGTSKVQRRPYAGEDPFLYVLAGPLQTSAGLYRIDALRRVGGFTEGLPRAQEFDLHVRMALDGMRCGYTDQVLYAFRKSESGISGDLRPIAAQKIRILQNALDQVRKHSPPDLARLAAIQDASIQTGRDVMNRGGWSQALTAFRLARTSQAHRHHPSSRLGTLLMGLLGFVPGLMVFESLRALKTTRFGRLNRA